MLAGLMAGKALTASELAQEAGVTLQTSSAHLSKLLDGVFAPAGKQGRHKYVVLDSSKMAKAIEALMGLAVEHGLLHTRAAPHDQAMRAARKCSNHLVGSAGVKLYESLLGDDFLAVGLSGIGLSSAGQSFMKDRGLDTGKLVGGAGPMSREYLDRSERKSHLSGKLGHNQAAPFLATINPMMQNTNDFAALADRRDPAGWLLFRRAANLRLRGASVLR